LEARWPMGLMRLKKTSPADEAVEASVAVEVDEANGACVANKVLESNEARPMSYAGTPLEMLEG
jgi:hypothetical protein